MIIPCSNSFLLRFSPSLLRQGGAGRSREGEKRSKKRVRSRYDHYENIIYTYLSVRYFYIINKYKYIIFYVYFPSD